jgi:uncharacterized membrane protein
MGKGRLEAFSDGVIAILITIMVLELKVPHGENLAALQPLIPTLLCYVLSFVYLGIYWNNHHHLMHTVTHVSGAMLWANNHLLFWLSLVPFTTGWMGENHFEAIPTAMYGVTLLMAGVAFYILQLAIVAAQGEHSLLREALGRDWKGKASPLIYLVALLLAFRWPQASLAMYAGVAIMWFIPDKRIERVIDHGEAKA